MTAPDPVVAVIAAAIKQHYYVPPLRSCKCQLEGTYPDLSAIDHEAHVAEVVAAAVREAGLVAPEELAEVYVCDGNGDEPGNPTHKCEACE